MFKTTWIIIRTRLTTKVTLEWCSCGIRDNSANKAEQWDLSGHYWHGTRCGQNPPQRINGASQSRRLILKLTLGLILSAAVLSVRSFPKQKLLHFSLASISVFCPERM